MNDNPQKFYVYVLECENNSFYTGYTTDLLRRYREHIHGRAAAKFTRSFKVRKIIAAWEFVATKGDAMRIEQLIKKMNRQQKELLISGPTRLEDIVQNELKRNIELMVVNKEIG